jgi:FMN phosphatase YigB (HAD superfamily)
MNDDVVFLFDVDNTLLDNDRFQSELRAHLSAAHGDAARDRYWDHFEQLWSELGYADYIGAAERYRLDDPHDTAILRLGGWILDYPFAELLYPGALEAARYAGQSGRTVILSDGDAVFQPRKIERAGLWKEFDGNVLIYVHKQLELAAIERAYPAERYVLIDDKIAILDAVKQGWGKRVTTVFPKQGHYAFDPALLAKHLAADITIGSIAELMTSNQLKVKLS